MFCLRCGRDTENEQVFCEKCLNTMKENPIKPGTAVQILDRDEYFSKKERKVRESVSPEVLVPQLRRTVRILISLILILSVSLGITAWLLFQSLSADELPMAGTMGRNYTSEQPEFR